MITSAIVVVVVMVAAVVAIIISTYRRLKRDDNVTMAGVRAYLETLLNIGRDRSFLIVTDISSDTFVQFAKYVWPQNEIGLRLGFPRAPWSEQYYESLQTMLDRRGITFTIQPTGTEPVTEVLHVDCGRDVDLATSLVEDIFHAIFDVPRDRRFRVRGEGFGGGPAPTQTLDASDPKKAGSDKNSHRRRKKLT